MAKNISIEEYFKRLAELDQEKQVVIAQLEAEIKERQDLLAKLKGDTPKPAGKKRNRRTKAELEAARATKKG